MARLAVLAAVALLLPLAAGCAQPFPSCTRDGKVPDLTAGDLSIMVCVQGDERTARIHVPSVIVQPTPILVMLHGGGGNAKQFEKGSQMDDVADDLRFIVVYPQGMPQRRGSDFRTWNAIHCCGKAFAEQSRDAEFVGRLVEVLVASWSIDGSRIGVAGHSNGAMMAYRLAAERSDLFASVMPVAGTIGGQPDPGAKLRVIAQPERPVSVLILHARDDPRVPYEGGDDHSFGQPRTDLSVGAAVAFWRAVDGITAEPKAVTRADGVQEELHGSGGGVEVRVLTTVGGHGWPGADKKDAPAVPGASAEIGRFLLGHPRAS